MLKKTRLFDKFIDIEFTKEIMLPLNSGLAPTPLKLSYKCSRTGVKPNITISGEYVGDTYIKGITVKIQNMFVTVDMAMYKYIKVVAGYTDGSSTSMEGRIMNCYIEKPNPDGFTVFQVVLGSEEQQAPTKENVEFVLPSAGITYAKMANKVATEFGIDADVRLAKAWASEVCPLINSTLTFTSLAEAIVWLKGLFSERREINTSLPPVVISFIDKLMTVQCTQGNTINTISSIILDRVSNVYFYGGYMSITAPWIPTLKPQMLIQMPSTFFKGRLGSMFVKRSDTLFVAYSVSFIFSTEQENSMTVKATVQQAV